MDLTRRCFAAAGFLAVLVSLLAAVAEGRRPQASTTLGADAGLSDATLPDTGEEDEDDDDRQLALLVPCTQPPRRPLASRGSGSSGRRMRCPRRRRHGASRGPPSQRPR
ncbi:MAG: hypothetical protein ACKON8_02970 [Planctomycetota bacterium]